MNREEILFDGKEKNYTGRKFTNSISCYQCGISTARSKQTLIATVTKTTEKRVTIEVTEPQERLMSVKNERPFAFPFYLKQGGIDVNLCSLNCLRRFIEESK